MSKIIDGETQPEVQLKESALELYEIMVEPINVAPGDPQVNTFRWIKNNPGIQVSSVPQGDESQKFRKYQHAERVRYRQIENSPGALPSHIILMEDLVTGRTVVAKNHTKSVGSGWSMWSDPSGEAHWQGIDHHPYIADVYGLAADKENGLFVIMEYLPNGTLEEWLAETHPVEEIAGVANKLSSALEHVHTKRRLIYQDLKPLNVGFDEYWNPKLLDFELAEPIKSDGTAITHQATPAYEAPEQKELEPVSIQTDVYRIGATLFSIFIDRFDYFDDQEKRKVFENSPDALIPFKEKYREILSVGQQQKISAVVRKALSKQKEDRHQTVAEFNSEFQSALNN